MAGTFVSRLKRPFLRIRRCRSLKVGSNELHLQESNAEAGEIRQKTTSSISSSSTPPQSSSSSAPSSNEKTFRGAGVGRADRYSLGHHHHSLAPAEETVSRKASVEPLVDAKRRRSDEWRRRRRRTFDGEKGRMCRDGSLQTLFQDSESSETSSQSAAALCAAPIFRKLSNLFAAKKQVQGDKGLRVSCIQGLDWSSNLQNYRPIGYKLFSKRKRSLTLVRCKKDVPVLEDSIVSKAGGGGGSVKTSPRRTPGRELTSSPMSPPVTLARSEEACPFVLEDTSVYEERIHMTEATKASSPTRSLSPFSREQALSPTNFDDDDEDLGMEEDDSYSGKYDGVPQEAPSMVFFIRPRRYTLAPSRFQREHLERLRNAAKVSPSRRNSEGL